MRLIHEVVDYHQKTVVKQVVDQSHLLKRILKTLINILLNVGYAYENHKQFRSI